MNTTYVFGHRNPDSDAICSAISYATLKNTQAPGHVPARLGPLNRESRYVLERFGVEPPRLLPHIHITVEDVMSRDPHVARRGQTIFDVGLQMQRHQVHAIPLVDDEGRPVGIVTSRSFSRGLFRERYGHMRRETATTVGEIERTLGATRLAGNPDAPVAGHTLIAIDDATALRARLGSGDVVIAGDRPATQRTVLDGPISALVLAAGASPAEGIVSHARERGVALLATELDPFEAALVISLTVPVESLMRGGLLVVTPDTIASQVTTELLTTRHGMAMVTGDDGRLRGVVTKSDLLARRRHQVILVDHSERAQSADGIERAEIVEIVDHHRLGGLESAGPILALIAPVGATCTLVFRRYNELGVTPTREMAGLMLSAILSDTMLLRSPTTTPEDEAAVHALGTLIGEDPLRYGREMVEAKFDIASQSAAEIVAGDQKRFDLGPSGVVIAQVEVADLAPLLARRDELLAALEARRREGGEALALLMVTDILGETTELLATGETRLAERAFNAELRDGSLHLPGVLSRKKQVVPPLAATL